MSAAAESIPRRRQRSQRPAMSHGKRGLNARMQPRNSRGQFAPAREWIYVDSEDSNFSSEVRVPGGKRIKGEAQTPIPAKKIMKGESSTPTLAKEKKGFNGNKDPYDSDVEDRVKWLVQSANNDATKKLKRRTSKACTRVDGSFEKLFVDIKYGVLEPLAHTNKGASVQKLRQLFDIAKADARELVMRQKSCHDLDGFLELLFVDVKYGMEKALEYKNKKIKKTKK